MTKLNLSVAVGPYDRTRALIDGAVQIDGVNAAGDPDSNILMDVPDKFRGYTHMALRVASIPATIACASAENCRSVASRLLRYCSRAKSSLAEAANFVGSAGSRRPE